MSEETITSPAAETTVGPVETIVHDLLSLGPELREQFAVVFRSQLEPLYGPQDDALDKIFRIQDRYARVILNDSQEIAGVLVFKKEPIQEYGQDAALEIKTLMLVNPEVNGGRGFGAKFVNEVEHAALEMHAKSIVVTVAADKPESQIFFLKHGFVAEQALEDAYRPGNTETVFVKKVIYDDPV